MTTLGLAILATPLLVVVLATRAGEVDFALALPQPGRHRSNAIEPVLLSDNLRPIVQYGLVC